MAANNLDHLSDDDLAKISGAGNTQAPLGHLSDEDLQKIAGSADQGSGDGILTTLRKNISDPAEAALASGLREQSWGGSKYLENLSGRQGEIDQEIKDHPIASGVGRVASYLAPYGPATELVGGITRGLGGLAKYAGPLAGFAKYALIPAELGAATGASDAARKVVALGGQGEAPTKGITESIKDAATDPMSLGFSALLKGSGDLINSTGMAKSIYAKSGIGSPQEIERAATNGTEAPYERLMNSGVWGSRDSMRNQLETMRSDAGSTRSSLLNQAADKAPNNFSIPREDITGGMQDKARNISLSGENADPYYHVLKTVESQQDVPGGYSPRGLEEIGQNIKGVLRSKNSGSKMNQIFGYDPAPFTTQAQREIVSKISAAQRGSEGSPGYVERILGPDAGKQLNSSVQDYGDASSGLRNLSKAERTAATQPDVVSTVSKALPYVGASASALTGNPAPFLGSLALSGASKAMRSPMVRSGLGVALNEAANNPNINSSQVLSIMRLLAQDRASSGGGQ